MKNRHLAEKRGDATVLNIASDRYVVEEFCIVFARSLRISSHAPSEDSVNRIHLLATFCLSRHITFKLGTDVPTLSILNLRRRPGLPNDKQTAVACGLSHHGCVTETDRERDRASHGRAVGHSSGGKYLQTIKVYQLMLLRVPGISAVPHEENLRYFDVMIHGPSQSPYEGCHALFNHSSTTFNVPYRRHFQARAFPSR